MGSHKQKGKLGQANEKLFYNNEPLYVQDFDFVRWQEAFDLTSFPLVDDFTVRVKQTEVFGLHLYFQSEQLGQLASFPWWDNVEKDLPQYDSSKIPVGTLEAPFDDCEQSWQIIIFKKEDHVYIMQGQDPGCGKFATWFRVALERYYDEWMTVLRQFNSA